MLKTILSIFAVLLLQTSFAGSHYYWIGGTSGQWTTAVNWSSASNGAPGTFYPSANDFVHFDNGQSVSVDYNLSSNDVGFAGFYITNNTQLELINNFSVSKSLTINSGANTSYFEIVQAGSSLTLKSNTNNALIFGSNTYSSGRMVFNGPVYCINQSINTTYGPTLNSTDSIIINDLFYVGPSISTTVRGSNPIGSKFRLSPTGVYQIDKNEGFVIGGKWLSGSLLKITGTINQLPTYWGGYPYTYGGVEINIPNATSAYNLNFNLPSNITFQGDFTVKDLGKIPGMQLAASPSVTVQGDFVIEKGNVILAKALSSPGGTVTVYGGLSQDTSTVLNLQEGSYPSTLKIGGDFDSKGTITETGSAAGSAVEMNGSSSQYLSLTGNVIYDVSLSINNSNGIVALSDIYWSTGTGAILNLINGSIDMNLNNKNLYIRNSSNNAINGGSLVSHVIGRLTRTTSSASEYTFPISNNISDLATLKITPVNNNITDWNTSFIRNNSNNNIGLPTGITSISSYRWDIDRTGITPADASIMDFKYSNISTNGITDSSIVNIVRWDTNAWTNLGGTYDGNAGINSISSPISSFGSFSFGFIGCENNYWNGSVSAAWENPANWDCGAIPTASTTVYINNNKPNYPTVNSMAICKKLYSAPGVSVTVTSGYKLEIVGH